MSWPDLSRTETLAVAGVVMEGVRMFLLLNYHQWWCPHSARKMRGNSRHPEMGENS